VADWVGQLQASQPSAMQNKQVRRRSSIFRALQARFTEFTQSGVGKEPNIWLFGCSVRPVVGRSLIELHALFGVSCSGKYHSTLLAFSRCHVLK
jgi:hypothetical protein